MWGKIKREYPRGDTFAWPVKEAASKCKCSKSDVGPIMKRLEKLGAITLIQAGKLERTLVVQLCIDGKFNSSLMKLTLIG